MNRFFFYFIIFSLISFNLNSKDSLKFFNLGKENFKNKNFDKAKINFEKDIVRNTKNQESYLYLAKIHNIKKNNSEFEKNLNTALLLDPKNEEALYLLIKKKIKDADYDIAKSKYDLFEKICSNMCLKKEEIKKLLKKNKS